MRKILDTTGQCPGQLGEKRLFIANYVAQYSLFNTDSGF